MIRYLLKLQFWGWEYYSSLLSQNSKMIWCQKNLRLNGIFPIIIFRWSWDLKDLSTLIFKSHQSRKNWRWLREIFLSGNKAIQKRLTKLPWRDKACLCPEPVETLMCVTSVTNKQAMYYLYWQNLIWKYLFSIF